MYASLTASTPCRATSFSGSAPPELEGRRSGTPCCLSNPKTPALRVVSRRYTGRLRASCPLPLAWPLPYPAALFPIKTVIKIKRREARATVSAAFRSVDGSWRRRVGKLNDRRGDPAPGIGAVVITVGRQLVDARAAFLKRLVAVTLQ